MITRINNCRSLISKINKSYKIVKPYSTASTPKINAEILSSLNDYKPGGIYNGFICTNTQHIPDFNMTAYHFTHEKTGCEYFHLNRNDSNNLFSVNFRTTPFNSTGLPHILEHTVLCGSEKYQIRDPFFKMLNRSLATFMNAMTGPDYTIYPFSSTNYQDFRNLQSIYLDACFKPNLKYLDFLQEGWRLENSNLNDKNSPHIFKGVVYNEMKGAFSENSAVFGQKFFNQILPGHTYGYVSGGDPVEITKLTHKDLVDFHQKYYHPSNARIFSYGNFDLDKSMEYVNERYLNNYDKIDNSYSIIPPQKRWSTPKKSHISSRFDNMGAPFEKQNQIAIGFLMTDITDTYETFLLSIMSELLVKGPNSYFYKTLIEPNISGGYNQLTGFDSTIKDTMFVVGLQDLTVEDFDKVVQIFDQTIDQVIENGFEDSHIQSVLHNIELHTKHQTTRFGLNLLFSLTPLWNHNGDLVKSLCISSLVNELKGNLQRDPKYLQKKVDHYFRQNKHKLIVTMSPDKEYEKKFIEEESKILSEKVKNLNETDRERIYKEGLQLSESQKSVPNLEVLPCLKLSDIRKEIEKSHLEHIEFDNVKVQICTTDTNGVTYFNGILDASNFTKDQMMLIPLLNNILTEFGTKDMNYRDFDKLICMKTSGISFRAHIAESTDDASKYSVGIAFNSYSLDENVDEMLKIFNDIFTKVELNDVSRFEMLLESYMSDLAVGIAQSGHVYAMQSSAGLVSESIQLKERLSGIEHIAYMKELTKNHSTEEILVNLQKLSALLFSQSNMKCALNVSPGSKVTAISKVRNFVDHIPKRSSNRISLNKSKSLNSSCVHNIMNIPVNYCAKSIKTVSYMHKDYATLKVFAKFLSAKYLLPVVREQNGAYGSGAKISMDGIFNFFSYRDPNSRSTLNVFDDTYKWAAEKLSTIDEQVLFEAKLGILQQLDVPISPMERGIDEFKFGISDEKFAAHRQKILNVTIEDLKNINEKYFKSDADKVVGRSVLGPENENLVKDGENWKTVNLN